MHYLHIVSLAFSVLIFFLEEVSRLHSKYYLSNRQILWALCTARTNAPAPHVALWWCESQAAVMHSRASTANGEWCGLCGSTSERLHQSSELLGQRHGGHRRCWGQTWMACVEKGETRDSLLPGFYPPNPFLENQGEFSESLRLSKSNQAI